MLFHEHVRGAPKGAYHAIPRRARVWQHRCGGNKSSVISQALRPLDRSPSHLQGDDTEERVCPPLFGFASSDDADRLDSIADEVLGPEDDAPAVRSDPLSRV